MKYNYEFIEDVPPAFKKGDRVRRGFVIGDAVQVMSADRVTRLVPDSVFKEKTRYLEETSKGFEEGQTITCLKELSACKVGEKFTYKGGFLSLAYCMIERTDGKQFIITFKELHEGFK